MIEVAKYKLKEIFSHVKEYKTYRIVGLKMPYYNTYYGDGVRPSFGGACALLKSKEHPGYGFLCEVNTTYKSGYGDVPIYAAEFKPLYDENGKLILIKYDEDVLFCSIMRGGYKESFDSDELVDATLDIPKNGVFTGFDHKL